MRIQVSKWALTSVASARFCQHLKNLMLVRIFTTVFEFQNRNIYLFLFDTEARRQRYKDEQAIIHAGGGCGRELGSPWLQPGLP
jgi:hypothetical protein